MVLDADDLQPGAQGEAGGEIVGMGIGRHGNRAEIVEPVQAGDDAAKGVEGLGRLQVADVLTDEDIRSDGDGDGILQVRPHRQDGRQRPREGNGERGVSPGPAEDELAPHHDAGDGVVHVSRNSAIVHQEAIGHAAEPRQGLPLLRADRLVREIAAGGDHGKAQLPEQDVMQRGIWKHRAQIGVAGGHRRGDGLRRPVGTARQEDDRAFRGKEETLFETRDVAVNPHRLQRGQHQGQRFLLAVLPLPQAKDRVLVSGVHQQVKASQPLQRQDPACPHGVCGHA